MKRVRYFLDCSLRRSKTQVCRYQSSYFWPLARGVTASVIRPTSSQLLLNTLDSLLYPSTPGHFIQRLLLVKRVFKHDM